MLLHVLCQCERHGKYSAAQHASVLQSLFISILSGAGVIKTTDDSKNLQNFLIACEMLPASIFMLWAFPYTDYKASGMSL